MIEKDKRVIRKLIGHCDNIIRYTEKIDTEEAFTSDSMIAEASFFIFSRSENCLSSSFQMR